MFIRLYVLTYIRLKTPDRNRFDTSFDTFNRLNEFCNRYFILIDYTL